MIAFKWEGFIKISVEALTDTLGLACRLASWLMSCFSRPDIHTEASVTCDPFLGRTRPHRLVCCLWKRPIIAGPSTVAQTSYTIRRKISARTQTSPLVDGSTNSSCSSLSSQRLGCQHSREARGWNPRTCREYVGRLGTDMHACMMHLRASARTHTCMCT